MYFKRQYCTQVVHHLYQNVLDVLHYSLFQYYLENCGKQLEDGLLLCSRECLWM